MAVQSMHFPLRDDVEWWVIACADLDELLTVGEAIAELYEMPKV